jgi:hypothetical protein
MNRRTPERKHSVPQSPFLAATTGPAAFVGRRDELASLTTSWDETLRANRSLLLIAGEPGMGKTRLCIEFARQCAAAGALCPAALPAQAASDLGGSVLRDFRVCRSRIRCSLMSGYVTWCAD